MTWMPVPRDLATPAKTPARSAFHPIPQGRIRFLRIAEYERRSPLAWSMGSLARSAAIAAAGLGLTVALAGTAAATNPVARRRGPHVPGDPVPTVYANHDCSCRADWARHLEADGCVIEGHVPADPIDKPRRGRLAVPALAVPGMPAGAPGMEGPPRRVTASSSAPDRLCRIFTCLPVPRPVPLRGRRVADRGPPR